MAKEKNSESAPRKTAATKKKSSAGGKAAAQKPEKAVAAVASASASSAASSAIPSATPSANHAHRVQLSEAELYQEISVLAYQFYCERGGHHGAHEADWHRAEQQVRAKYKK